MAEMKIRRTTVTVAEGGALRVEIAIADSHDIAAAQETASLAVVVHRQFPNPSLAEIQIAALLHVRAVLDAQLGALRGIAGSRH